MKIAYIGNFTKIWDEEYIARSFEMLGHQVTRIPKHFNGRDVAHYLKKDPPDLVLFPKWEWPANLDLVFDQLKKSHGTQTACWLFDLYWGYIRQPEVLSKKFFRADWVFTTDGGHQDSWQAIGITHHCVRQGIYKEECFMSPHEGFEHNVIFVGSENPFFQERNQILAEVENKFTNFKWYGRGNTDDVRGTELNDLFAKTKVVIGDSVPSPHYWSNRVVETLGRGGFLIHRAVVGLKEAYPHLVTYHSKPELFNKIAYYLKHDEEREALRQKNFEWVRDNYTCEKQCQKLLNYIS